MALMLALYSFIISIIIANISLLLVPSLASYLAKSPGSSLKTSSAFFSS